ncbi:hypothetical protein QSH14_13420 [Proteus faecis]|uniref:Uncharacterized protein n=1 Tax=Proteus faecis TaxID=2050967 RepID=A0AAW7CNM9_9GAMM|nr:hypothetical protein [Proteus faecis]QNH66222.1 hypothetical protein H7F13_02635 [Proteus vulgaris]MCT8250665.1 hypothetical protein [Proteus faecis]MDL5168238.1 hypothetical protein [Proteus faecis]MDL5276223.1 hypothetical protein [Proteus faecis]MDL5279703.1 hypothetical protein [Proteus faecis]
MKKYIISLALILVSPAAFSHTALLSCFDEGDGTVTCEGGFSDGSSASGVDFHLKQDGKIILSKKFNELNEVSFEKPKGDYSAVLNAGEGHEVTIKSSDIN